MELKERKSQTQGDVTSLSWRLILKKGLPYNHLPEVCQQLGTCKFEAPKNHMTLFNMHVHKGGRC